MASFFNSPQRQLAAAHRVLAHVAESCDMPVGVRLWDGSAVSLSKSCTTSLAVTIRSPGVIGSLVRWPTLDNLVRQYATGGIDFQGGSLMEFVDAFRGTGRRPKFRELSKSLLLSSVLPFLCAPADTGRVQHAYDGDYHGLNSETRNNRDYIQFHYDIGNDFYKLFLDSEMLYSCGYFTDWGNSLEQAQQDKLEMICRKLRLQPGDRFLDIGCGWGALICYAAEKYGVQAHGVTLSQTQHDRVVEKIRERGLAGQVTVELKDYRHVEGTFDKISSIGMFEHVGIANMPTYFGKIYSLLRDRGILLNHGISRRAKSTAKRFRKRRPEHQLIAKYIFPGGELDHVGHTVDSLEAAKFDVHDVEGWREHYAMTTRHWCERLSAHEAEAIRLVGPERYRLWVAYLACVSGAFRDGSIQIFQVVASKHSAKGLSELPPTRSDLYRPVETRRRAVA